VLSVQQRFRRQRLDSSRHGSDAPTRWIHRARHRAPRSQAGEDVRPRKAAEFLRRQKSAESWSSKDIESIARAAASERGPAFSPQFPARRTPAATTPRWQELVRCARVSARRPVLALCGPRSRAAVLNAELEELPRRDHPFFATTAGQPTTAWRFFHDHPLQPHRHLIIPPGPGAGAPTGVTAGQCLVRCRQALAPLPVPPGKAPRMIHRTAAHIVRSGPGGSSMAKDTIGVSDPAACNYPSDSERHCESTARPDVAVMVQET